MLESLQQILQRWYVMMLTRFVTMQTNFSQDSSSCWSCGGQEWVFDHEAWSWEGLECLDRSHFLILTGVCGDGGVVDTGVRVLIHWGGCSAVDHMVLRIARVHWAVNALIDVVTSIRSVQLQSPVMRRDNGSVEGLTRNENGAATGVH